MGWEDIEEMPTANLRDELLALLDKEVEYAHPSPSSSSSSSDDDDEDDVVDGSSDQSDAIRNKICQWKYECVDYFLFDREVVHLSMHYFDRYMFHKESTMMRPGRTSTTGAAARTSMTLCHLLALSSLHLACKLHGVMTEPSTSSSQYDDDAAAAAPVSGSERARHRLRDFCHVSRGNYCPEMLQDMEMSLLTTLKWRLHPPTPNDFLIRFVKILSLTFVDYNDPLHSRQQQQQSNNNSNAGKGSSAFELARYQIELGAYSPELCKTFLPSTVALAAILNAMDSKIVRTNKAVIPSHIRRSFLERVECLGGGFAVMHVEGEDMVRARTILKNLCSATIVLPGQILDCEQQQESESRDTEFQAISTETNSFEFELPEVPSLSSSTISPVSVTNVSHF